MSNWKLRELEPNGAGETRWSMGENGPAVYLTTDKDTALRIQRAYNSHDALVSALEAAIKRLESVDALYLHTTASPKECDLHEVVQGRKALALAVPHE